MKKITFILALIMFVGVLMTSCGGEYTRGTITETGYYSEWLGLEFVPTQNMIMASAAEVEEMMGLTQEEKQDIQWSKVIEAYEMMATDAMGLDSVVVMTEGLTKENNTVNKFIDKLKSEFSYISEVEITYAETCEEVIAGEKYTRFEYEISLMNQTYKQIMFLRKIGERMAVITITASNEGVEEMFLSCFKAK